MAYDKFIKKKGKIYGPYIYESVRDGDKVLTKYIGKGKNFSVRDIEEKRAPFTFNSSKIISMFLIVLGILALVTLLQFPTARVTMEISSTYDVGKPILGSLNLGFKPGELIPAGSSVLVSLGSQEKEFLISDLVDSDSVFGNFYAEGVDLEGEGEGIGIIGEKVSYPEIDFSFIVQDKGEDVEIGEGVGGGTDEKESEEVVVEEPSQDEDEGVIEEPKDKTDGKDKKDTSESEEDGSGETNTGDDVESSPESSESSEDSGSESDSSESGSDSGGDGGSSSDESGEELSVVPTQPTLSGGENNNEGSDSGGDSVSSGDSGGSDSGGSEGGSDSVSSGDSGGDSGGGDSGGDSGAGITGSVVQTNKVDGKVSYENDFSYNLEEGQTAKLVSGSIKVDGKKIDTDSVNLIVEGNVVRVSTEYFISEEGFGEEYLGVETEIISINLEDVNILAEQGILQVNLDYNGVEIVEVSGEINVEGGNLTTGNLTETNMSTNLTIGNLTETNLTLVNATLVNLTDGNLSFVGNVEDIVILKGENYSFDLSVYFANAESYNVSLMENISVEILESEMKFVPDVDFVGRRVGKIFGYKGNESVESNIFSVSVIDSNYSENTIQFDAEIRKPVKWRKIVKLGEPSNLNIQLHKSSENITVNKIVGEIVEKISDESVSITAQVISGDVTAELEIEEEPGIIRFFKNLFSGIGNFITGRAIEVIEEETVVNVEITENSSEYEIEYYTVAPEAYERNVSENKKEIVVTAPDELNYTNVLTYTTVREVLDSEKRIKLYWIREVVDTVVVPTQPTLSVEEIINDEIVDTEEEIINEINETDFVGNEIDIVVDNNESLVEIGEELINNNTESEVDSDISDENVSIASISGFAVNNDGDEVVDDSNQQAQEELVEGGGVGVRYERVLMNYTGYDLDNNGMIDYVEWITPHLSNQTFELIIEITGAEHLDENRVFIEDIFEQVNSRDFVYKEIPVGNYVRVTFEEELDSSKDITIYGYSNESGSVEVYEENGEVKIAEFGVISSDDVYKIYLSNLTGTQDVFDLKVVGGNVVFDYIVDPGTKIICPYGCRKLSPGNWTTNANITVQFFSNQTDDLNLSNATFLLWNSTGGLIHENTTNITGINNLTAWNWTFSYDDYYNWSVLVMDNDSNTNWSDSGESYSVINWTLLICNVTAPGVNFSAPTLPNNTATMNKTIEINTSISEICIDEIVYNWNGTNFTMYNDSLVLFMNFDNQSFQGEDESFVKDLSSYGNDGTITNARVNVTNCKYGKCLTFDGSGDYVDAGNFDDYTSGPLTISAWFKAEQQSEYAYLISKAGANSDNKYFVIGLDNSPDVYEANIFNGAASSGTVLIARQSGWQYLTYTWDGTNSLLYSNGVLVDSTTGTQSGGSASIKLGIGARYTTSWGSYFNGQMDEVMIWNRSLSASEVYQQYVSNLYKYDTDKWALWVNQGKNSTTGLFDGEYTYFTSVKDCCERENKTALWEFNVDTIAPYGVHVLPKNWTSTTNITVEFIVNSSKENYNLANVTLFIWNSSGGLVHQNTTNITGVVNYTFWNFTFTNNDVYNWSALIYDEAGNFNWTDEMNGLGAINWSLNETGIATDATNPAVTINLPLNKTYNTATILFNATTSESSLCFFSIDSGVYNYSMTSNGGLDFNYTNDSMEEGGYVANFYCNDTLGNLNDSEFVVFGVDTIFPQISIVYPTENSKLNTSTIDVNYTIVETNAMNCWMTNDSGVVNNSITCGVNLSQYTWEEGVNRVWVYANDTAGNINWTDVNFSVDTTVPSLTIESPANSTYGINNITFNVSANENLSWCGYSLDNDVNVSMTKFNVTYFNYTKTSLGEGGHNISFACNDSYNNFGSVAVRWFSVDSGAPTLNIESPTNNSRFNGTTVEFNVSANEDLSWCGFSWNNTGNVSMTMFNSTYANYTQVAIGDGWHNVSFACNDTSNNYAVTSMSWFFVDSAYPLINFTNPTASNNSNWVADSFYINVTTSDANNHSVFVDWNNSLVLWMTMDDRNASGDPTDRSSYGNDGDAVNDASFTDAGYLGGGFEFDGDGDGINFESQLLNEDIIVYIFNDNKIYAEHSVHANNVSSGYIPSAGEWVHVGYVLDPINDRSEIYINGELKNFINYTDFEISNSMSFWIKSNALENRQQRILNQWASNFALGWSPAESSFYFNGTIDDVMIFNRALNESEILSLYNANANQYFVNLTGLVDGNYTYVAYSQDLAGNINSSELREVQIMGNTDATVPNLVIESPVNNSRFNSSSVEFNVSGNENLDWCGFSWNNTGNVSMTMFNVTYANYTQTSIGEGWHNVSFSCNDTSNNYAVTSMSWFFVDSAYPLINFTNPTAANNSNWVADSFYINVTTSDADNHSVFVDWNNSLVLWMTMDDRNASGDPTDRSSYGNDGDAVGGAVFSDAGYLGGGFEFDGAGDYVEVSNPTNFEFGTESYTWSAWFKRESIGAEHVLFSKTASGSWASAGKQLTILDSNVLVWNVWSLATLGTQSITDSSWHHAVVSFNASSNLSTIYVDGVSDDSGTFAVGADDGSHVVRIGQKAGGNYFNGTIDDVMIFNRVLNQSEILSLYNANANQYFVNLTGLADGNYTYVAHSQDLGGNINSTELREVQIMGNTDATNPAVTINLPLNKTYNTATILFNATTSESSLCFFSIDSGIYNYSMTSNGGLDFNYTNDSMEEGGYVANFYCNDTLGNLNDSEFVVFGVDTIFPQISIVYPTENSKLNTSTIDVNYTIVETNAMNCWMTNDSGVVNNSIACGTNLSQYTWEEGANRVWVYANDTVGNINWSDVNFSVDTTSPSLTIESPANSTYGINNITFNVSANENLSWCGYSLDNDVNVSMTKFNVTYFNYTKTSLGEGGHNISFACNDSYNNFGSVAVRWFSVDSGAPTLNIESPTNNSRFNGTTVEFNVSGNENLDWCGFSWNNTGNVSMTMFNVTYANYTQTSIGEGWHNVSFSCNDTSNNYAVTGMYSFFVDTIYPTINFTNPTAANNTNWVADSFYINVTSSDANNHSVFVDWNNSLVLWMTMDDMNASGDPSDRSSYGNDGDAVNDASFTDAGYLGGGFEFDGAGDYVDADVVTSVTDNFTLSAWFKWDGATADNQIIAYNGRFGVNGYGIYLRYASSNALGFSFGGVIWKEYATPTTETWTHAVIVKNSGTTTLYVDGTTTGLTSGNTPNTPTLETVIGGRPSPDDLFNGTIDDVMIFSRALNQSEISALYNANANQYFVNFTGLVDGNYTYVAYSQDLGGNINSTELREVQIMGNTDATNPAVTINLPLNKTYNTATILFNATTSESSLCFFSIDSGVYNYSMTSNGGLDFNYTNDSMEEGGYVANFYCNDTLGNLNDSEFVVFGVDTIFPQISIVYPTENSKLNTSTIDVNYTIVETNGMNCWMTNDSGVVNNSITCGVNLSQYTWEEGVNRVWVYANDTAGNINWTDVNFSVDTTVPSLTIESPANSTYGINNITFNVSANENLSWCGYSLDNDVNVSMTKFNVTYFNYTKTSLGEGGHNISFACNDSYNNFGSVAVRWFSVDSGTPTLNIESPTNNSRFNGTTVEFNVSANEDLSWCGFSWNNTGNVSMTMFNSTYANYTQVAIGDGWHNVSFSCNDTSNNYAVTSMSWFFVDSAYPLINFTNPTASNNSNWVADSFYINVTTSDADNHSVFVDWNNSLVLWMTMDDRNASGDPTDRSSYGNDGDAVNDASFTQAGRLGGGFEFDGAGDYVSVSDSAELQSDGNLTIGFWLKENSYTLAQVWLAKRDAGGVNYQLYHHDDGEIRFYDGTARSFTGTNISNYFNIWTHFVYVINDTSIDLYVDGSLNSTAAASLSSDDANLFIGSYKGTDNFFNGTIDDVMIFSRALNESEILSLYNANANQYFVNMTGLADGNYTYVAYAQDLGGNINFSELREVHIDAPDTIYPLINFTNPTPANDTSTTDSSIEINVSITEANLDSLIWNWNGTNYTMYNDSLVLMMNFDNVSGLGEGYDNSENYEIVDLSSHKNNGTAWANGSGTTGPIWNSSGKYGGGFEFDGYEDYINVSMNVPKLNSTYMLWFRTRNMSSNAIYLLHGYPGHCWQPFIVITNYSTSNRLFTGGDCNGQQPDLYGSTNLNNNIWYHAAVVRYYNGTAEIYLNGVLDSQTTNLNVSQIINYTTGLVIGTHGLGAYDYAYFNGSIDEVRIWNRSLSAEEVSQQYYSNLNKYNSTQWYLYVNESYGEPFSSTVYNYSACAADTAGNENCTETRILNVNAINPLINFTNPTPANDTSTTNTSVEINVSITEANLNSLIWNWNSTNFTMYNDSLVLMMNFDNVSALGENDAYVVDVSKYGNNGFVNGSVMNLTGGRYGGGFEFDGVDDYVEIGTNVSSLRLTSALTVSAWIKYRNSSTLYPGIVDATDETVGGSGYLLYLENTTSNYQAKFMLHNNTRYRVESDSELLEGVWYYLVGTFNGSEQLLYVNGIKQSSTNSNAGVNYSSSLHLIGKYDAGGNHYFNGTIDEVRIWNRSLSAEEVAQQYMSNLNKYDSDSWLLYVNQSKNDTTALADGNYTYYASAKDASGNENRTDVWEVQIYSVDTTAPVINLSTPADDTSTTTTSHNFIFNVTDDNEISNCSLIVDNSVSVYNSSAITKSELNTITQTLSAGTHTWNVNCTDASNNIGSSTIYDLIITTPSSSTSSTSSGGGSGGGGGGTVSSTRKTGFRVSPSEINEKMVVREAKSVKMNVENTGDMKVVVVLSMGELKDIVFVSENEFQLGVDETREIELNIIAPDEAGIYAGFLRFEGSDGSVHEVPIAINVRSGKFLFDTSISVLADVVSLGNVLMTHVNLIEVGRNEKLDVTANYIIRDYQGKTYYESSDTFFVEGDKEYDKEFSLAGLPEGKYLVGVELVYPDGIATSSASFQIVRDEFNIRMLILIGLGVLMFGVIILVVMMVRRRRKIRRKK